MMNVMRVVVAFLMVLLVAGAETRGQTTRPAPAAFGALVQQVAEDLAAGEIAPLSDALASDGTLQDFEGQQHSSADKLVVLTSGASVVSTRVYGQIPSALASDLAGDFEKDKDVPESVRQQMMPGSEAIVRANVTAAQWIIQTLAPDRRQFVGVIAMCPHPEPVAVNVRPRAVRPVFILIKGESAGGKVQIKQIVFGNPLDSSR